MTRSEKELDEAVKEAVKAKLEDIRQKNKAVANVTRKISDNVYVVALPDSMNISNTFN
ncbi:hypothetical protein A2U01_0063887, partial [Trifolium medium]|nr:hypothetical protein [Trifolium medium]